MLLPFTEHAPFDLVAYLDDAFYRVQVKFRTATNGRVTVQFSSSWADRHGSHHRPMPRDEVDAVAIYCPDTMQIYYLDPSDFRSRVNVRLEPARTVSACASCRVRVSDVSRRRDPGSLDLRCGFTR